MIFLKIFVVVSPWMIKRWLLHQFYGYNLHPTARIGISWIFPSHLSMAKGAKIASLTVAVNLDKIEMKEFTSIGRGNWITGFSTKRQTKHFSHQSDRKSELLLGEHSAITKNHHIDCTSTISIGKFVTIAGYHSQFLTHSVDIVENRQHSDSIEIGDYCFVGTNCVFLGGALLPNHSVLGAKSLLNKAMPDSYSLYGGVPAKKIKELDKKNGYFTRKSGFIF